MIQSFIISMATYCLILSPVYVLFRYIRMRKRPKLVLREISMYMFFLYCVSIFSQTVIPKFTVMDRNIEVYFEKSFVSSNFVPFETILLYVHQLQGPLAEIAFYNLAGNVILFVPFGVFIPFLWRVISGPFKMLMVSLCIPLFIECTQYFIGRSVDVDDVILNTAAIYIGYWMFLLFYKFAHMRENQEKMLLNSK